MYQRFDNVLIVPKLNSEGDSVVVDLVDMIEDIASKTAYRVNVCRDKLNIPPNTLIIAVGGDGTMLEAMRLAIASDNVALGVNMGKVGFLSDISVSDGMGLLRRSLTSILAGEAPVTIEQRTVLETSASPMLACNEVSISRVYADSMISYDLLLNDITAGIHKANSLIVATANGSTAYSLSAGGVLMMPEADVLQIVPVAPIKMTSRPIIVPASTDITLNVWGEGISVRLDGQVVQRSDETYTAVRPFELSIRAFHTKAKVLHLSGWNYFDTLSQKLGWIKQ